MNQYNQMPYGQQYPYGQQMQPFAGQMPYGQQMPYMGQIPSGTQPIQGMMEGQQMTGAPIGAQDWKNFCKRYTHHFVNMQTTDGQQYDGIIEGTDQESVYMLVPDGDVSGEDEQAEQRDEYDEETELETQYRFGGYPWYGGYWYPRRFRRFRRYRFPFFRIGGFYFPFFF